MSKIKNFLPHWFYTCTNISAYKKVTDKSDFTIYYFGILVVDHCALHHHIHLRCFEISDISISDNTRVRIEYYIYTCLKSKDKWFILFCFSRKSFGKNRKKKLHFLLGVFLNSHWSIIILLISEYIVKLSGHFWDLLNFFIIFQQEIKKYLFKSDNQLNSHFFKKKKKM